MREIFSVRFVAAAAAVVGLFFVLTTIFATREVITGDGGRPDTTVPRHRIDLVEQVFSSRDPSFRLDAEGFAATDTELIIDGARSLRIVTGTPGEDDCPGFGQIGACAVVADLLGEAVVWFALVPMGRGRSVEMPAIDTLADGVATLVNGWQLPYAAALDRRCDEEYASYRELRDTLGDDFTSVFDIDARRLVAVVCGVRVPYAPAPPTTDVAGSTTTVTDGSDGPDGSGPLPVDSSTTSPIGVATSAP